MQFPALRPLDVFPAEHEGKTYFCLKDPQGFSDSVAFLTAPQFFVAASLDGRSQAGDIAAAFARRFSGAILKISDIEKIVQTLDEGLFLDSERYREHLAKVKKEYALLPKRPAALAGYAYDGDPQKLRRQLESYFNPPGPGLLESPSPVCGLVAPHIDFGRGGAAYAWTYREISSLAPADLYVIFGVAHMGISYPLALSLKDYGTPLGDAVVDKELAQRWVREAPFDLLEEELAHRREHSAEFQAVWLRFRLNGLEGRSASFKILPVLFSSLTGPDGGMDPRADGALDALEPLLRNYSGRVCLLAGVDLAHVGPRFGDEEPVDQLISWMEIGDRDSLQYVLSKDAPGFYRSVMADGGKRKVCGLGALYGFTRMLSRLFPKSQGSLLHYGHASDPAGGEVSFASMVFR